jgi:hypothetical protein
MGQRNHSTLNRRPGTSSLALVNPESPRAGWWLEVFPGGAVPVQSAARRRALVPGHMDTLVYELDLVALTAEERERLEAVLSRHFHLAREEVFRDLEAGGCPILCADVTCVSSTAAAPRECIAPEGTRP